MVEIRFTSSYINGFFPAVMLLALMFGSLALAPIVSTAQGTAQAVKQEIRVALFQPRTAAALNFYGTWSIQGFHLGLEYSTGFTSPENLGKLLTGGEAVYSLPDGRRIVVKVYDTQGKPDVAVARAKEAIESWRADIMAGETFSSVAVALAAVAKEYEIPFFVFPAAAASITQSPTFNKYVFRVARNAEQDALAMIDYAVRVYNFTRFAFIAADYEFGWSYIEAIQYALSLYPGARIVDIEWVPLTTTDFRPYIERALASRPSALGIIWAGDFSLIYRDLAALGVLQKVPLLGLMIDLYTTNFINYCLPGLQNILENLTAVTYDAYVPDRPGEVYKVLRDMMIRENIYPYDFLRGHSCKALDTLSRARIPDLWHAAGFATAQFIVDAIKAVPDLNKDRLIAYLEGKSMETPMGPTTIRPEDHQALRPYYLVKYVVDSDPSSETYGLLIGKYMQTIPAEKIAPRILTSYKPYPKTFSLSIKAPTTAGIAPFSITISAVIEGGVPPYTCTWDLGDGSMSTGLSISHTYKTPGIYLVKVKCSDYIGLNATSSIELAVLPGTSPQTIATATITTVTLIPTTTSPASMAEQAPASFLAMTIIVVVLAIAVAGLAAYLVFSRR